MVRNLETGNSGEAITREPGIAYIVQMHPKEDSFFFPQSLLFAKKLPKKSSSPLVESIPEALRMPPQRIYIVYVLFLVRGCRGPTHWGLLSCSRALEAVKYVFHFICLQCRIQFLGFNLL